MKRRLHRIAVSITAALLLSLSLYAQQTVHGVLRSATGDPLKIIRRLMEIVSVFLRSSLFLQLTPGVHGVPAEFYKGKQ